VNDLLSNLIYHQSYTLSSDTNGFAKTTFRTNQYNLVSASCQGILCVPFNGGDGYWYIMFVSPATWNKLPNTANKSVSIFFQAS
jgi:hypothetical protein